MQEWNGHEKEISKSSPKDSRNKKDQVITTNMTGQNNQVVGHKENSISRKSYDNTQMNVEAKSHNSCHNNKHMHYFDDNWIGQIPNIINSSNHNQVNN